MTLHGWSKTEIKKTEELPDFAWFYGYFHTSQDDWDGTWRRNLSELMMGYFTKFGDGGADILPIADLLKSQVKERFFQVLDLALNFVTGQFSNFT